MGVGRADGRLVLHALWSARSRLYVWAEDAGRLPLARSAGGPTGFRPTSGRRPGRPATGTRTRTEGPSGARAGSGPPAHPFAASHTRILAALGIPEADARRERPVLLVPSLAGVPLPSTGLGPWPPLRTRARPSLAPWRVPAVALPPGGAVDVLLGMPPEPAAGLAPADSVRFLTRAVEFAIELVARGRVVPGLVAGPRGMPVARWLPAPTPEQAERLRLLAEAMPPACRAEAVDAEPDGVAGAIAGRRGVDVTGRDPGVVLWELVGAVVDDLARSALGGHRLLPPRRGRPPRVGRAAEAFVAALTSPDPGVDADPGELAKLEQALGEWHRSGVRAAGPVRTCFRLTPPEPAPDSGAGDGDRPLDVHREPTPAGPGSPAWRVEFLLQSSEDPSLIVPAAQVWRAGRRLTLLERTVEHPQERLLADLGHASRLYPALEEALDVARPVELVTDSEGAHSFLTEAAPLLEQAGFGVLVPPWWRSRAARLGVRLRARSSTDRMATSSDLLGLGGLCDFRYEVALGDQTLSESDLRDLAALKVPLVRVRGQWVELRQEEIEAALSILSAEGDGAEGQMSAAEVLRFGLGLAPSPTGLPVLGVEADGWLGELLAADRRLEPMAAPPGFRGALRPYQERGLAWLAFLDAVGLGACLADDMGLGKTIQLLALLLAERDRPRPARRARLRPTLLVCPMSVVGNWQREAERFAAGLTVHVHHGTDRRLGKAFARAVRTTDLVITTYGLAARDQDLLAGVRWERIVLDEAQNIKNAGAKQTRAVRALRAPRRIALTGTPVENRLSELWSIMEFLNPGLLGAARSFRERFAVPIERYRDEEAAGLLKRITGPFVLRRLKTDRSIIADLPDKVEMKVLCNLTREQATLYQAVVDDMLVRIEESEGMERRGLVLATMMKLKQVCNHPAHLLADGSRLDGRSGKLARLEEILEEVVAEGDRALGFTQFAEMGFLLRSHLEDRFGWGVPFLHGGVPKRGRDEMVGRFQSGEGPPVLLLSLKAGGVGLNLTAANHVIHFDRWWNPAVEDQATDRAFRIGQRRDVQVRKFVCVGTLEERIDRMIEEKRDLAERIVGTGEAWLTELSTSELRELVALSADAVAEG